jgi:hypothetical protein
MIRFEPGKSYYCRSACDYDCVWTFKVHSRTAKSIKITVDGKLVSRRIMTDDPRAEYAMPFGRYSMAPCLCASRKC